MMVAFGVSALMLLGGCGPDTTSAGFTLSSDNFNDGETLDVKYASFAYGDDSGRNPHMQWSNAPEKTKSFVLIMDDPDAKKVIGKTYIHWNVFLTDTTATEIKEGASYDGTMPSNAYQGRSTDSIPHYDGPNPPVGDTHTYQFCVYALSKAGLPSDVNVESEDSKIVDQSFTNDDFEAKYEDDILAKSCISGKFTGKTH
jgi:Raf kinase inhibitor-like YbhB/YbcL family protein